MKFLADKDVIGVVTETAFKDALQNGRTVELEVKAGSCPQFAWNQPGTELHFIGVRPEAVMTNRSDGRQSTYSCWVAAHDGPERWAIVTYKDGGLSGFHLEAEDHA